MWSFSSRSRKRRLLSRGKEGGSIEFVDLFHLELEGLGGVYGLLGFSVVCQLDAGEQGGVGSHSSEDGVEQPLLVQRAVEGVDIGYVVAYLLRVGHTFNIEAVLGGG